MISHAIILDEMGRKKETEKEKGREDAGLHLQCALRPELFLFDLFFQVLRAGLSSSLLAMKRVFLVDGIGEDDGATLAVD